MASESVRDTVVSSTYSCPDEGRIDTEVPTLQEVLGRDHGSAPATGEEMIAYAEALVQASPRVHLTHYGSTHAGRPLVYVTIGRPDRIKDLRAVLDVLRGSGDSQGRKAPDPTTPPDGPASVWVGCGIHGDEISGGDAALAVMYRLVAGTDAATDALLDALVVHIDPNANPDGRARHLDTTNGLRVEHPSHDPDDLAELGHWPFGRGNQYAVDLNRDLIFQTQPETRARTAAMRETSPQLVLELHEMGPDDSFLFASPGDPVNPRVPEHVRRWWRRLAEEHGDALDRLGQSWYRGEWNEVFYPGYQDIWPAYHGAVPIIFEQATTGSRGFQTRTGRGHPYELAVRNQAASIVANLRGAATGARELVTDWRAHRHRCATSSAPDYIVHATKQNLPRVRWLARLLTNQGIAVDVASAETDEVAAGSLRVRTGQPSGQLVSVLLDAEVPLPEPFVEVQRRQLDRGGPGSLYDVTAWSPAVAAGLQVERSVTGSAPGWRGFENEEHGGCDRRASRAYLFHDDEFRFTSALVAAGVRVRYGGERFVQADRTWTGGTCLVRLDEQPDTDACHDVLDSLGRRHEVDVVAVDSFRSDEGADLGGRTFTALRQRRMGVVAGTAIDDAAFSGVRHLLDAEAGVPASLVDPLWLARRRHVALDVLIVPELAEGVEVGDLWGSGAAGWLRRWVTGGGTLVAFGNAARVPGELDLGEVRAETAFDQHWLPSGAFARVDLDELDPVTTGAGPSVPVMCRQPALLGEGRGAGVPARFHSDPAGLAVAGHVWPEAAVALAGRPYLTCERVGAGHVVLFASDPIWRGAARATSRLFLRAAMMMGAAA